MKDYAKKISKCHVTMTFSQEVVCNYIREACAEAYADGRKAGSRRAVRLAEKYADEGWSLNQLRQAILNHNPKRRGGR